MRIVGIILVALGALALGWQGFNYAKQDHGAQIAQEHPPGVPPVVGGIAVVSGLILLASTNRRDDG